MLSLSLCREDLLTADPKMAHQKHLGFLIQARENSLDLKLKLFMRKRTKRRIRN